MTQEPADPIDIDSLVIDLQRRVDGRRSTGDYPPGLEEQLEAEFELIMAAVHRNEVNTTALGQLVNRVETSVAAVAAEGPTSSRVPGGSALHGATLHLVRRHTGTIAESVRSLGVDIVRALHEVHRLIDSQQAADERQLTEVIASVLDRLAVLDHLADAVVLLEERVAALEAPTASAT